MAVEASREPPEKATLRFPRYPVNHDQIRSLVHRIRQEVSTTGDVDEAIRRAVCTTGMAVTPAEIGSPGGAE